MRYTPYHQKQNNSDFQASALFYVMRSFWFLGGGGCLLPKTSKFYYLNGSGPCHNLIKDFASSLVSLIAVFLVSVSLSITISIA